MYPRKKLFENTLLLLLDLLGVIVSLGIAYIARYRYLYGTGEHGDQLWLLFGICLLLTLINVFIDFNHHFFSRGYFEEFISVVKEMAVLLVSCLVALFILHRSANLSRLVFTYFMSFGILLLFLERILIKQYMVKVYKQSKYSNRLLLITTEAQSEEVIKNLISYNEWNRILVGIVIVDKCVTRRAVMGFPVIAGRESAVDYVVHNNIDEVFFFVPDVRKDEEILQWVSEFEGMGIVVDINIDIFDIQNSGKKNLGRVGKYAVVTFARNVFSFRQVLAKRALDICGSLVGMVFLAITAVFVAPAIKIESPGPVFFGQTRVGKNGRKFKCYKFRSMYQDAEARKKELMQRNEVRGLMFKMTDDPRITKVGKFIRRTSIDELPQFWNILRGDMSLVGTRPPTVDEFERYETKHKCRLSMTPGLTGLWQISGRSDIKDFEEVVRLDMEYIDNWTLLKDIKIILQTIKVVICRSGSV